MFRLAGLSLLLSAIICTCGFADIVIDGYTDNTNDRFTNSNDFIASQFDLSGVGQAFAQNLTTRRWATAISRNVVLGAAHSTPTNRTLYFYEGNDPTATPVTRTVTSGMRIGSTDIWLGVLDSNLPETINIYEFASEMLSGTPNPDALPGYDNAGIYQGLNSYVFGLSPFDTSSAPDREDYNDQAVGRNRITGYAENVAFGANTDNDSLLMFHDDMGDTDYVDFEAEYRGGDSGGPLFVDIGGELRLVGVNSYLVRETEDGPFIASGATYLGNQADAINDFIELNAVPEPSSALILTIALSAMTARRRRNG